MTGDVIYEIVAAIAAVEGSGATPYDLDYSLHEYVDTEAIGRLAAADSGTWELTFEVPDHEVRVGSDGEIRVDGETVRRIDMTGYSRRV